MGSHKANPHAFWFALNLSYSFASSIKYFKMAGDSKRATQEFNNVR